MSPLELKSKKSVRLAVEEFKQLGREQFLQKYGYGKAREYFLYLNGCHYDSKAISGVAFGLESPDRDPLKAEEFSGGEKTVQRVLERLGFTVVRGRPKQDQKAALVLVENEATVGGRYDFWVDETGVQYQFPNQYKNRVQPGTSFVYYKGARRSGGRRGTPEYFGTGVIGDVWRDDSVPENEPKARWRWYCAIQDYTPFRQPVPAKVGEHFYEPIKAGLGWRTGVREISIDTMNQILSVAGVIPPYSPPMPRLEGSDSSERISLQESPEALLIPRFPKGGSGEAASSTRSLQAKEVGDRAEELVYRWLRESLPETARDSVDWLAHRGETPGWDIEYIDVDGTRVAVEVKGTTRSRFSTIELTRNEWLAACTERVNYVLALVALALSNQPRVELIRNPYGKSEEGELAAEPSGWRLSMVSKAP